MTSGLKEETSGHPESSEKHGIYFSILRIILACLNPDPDPLAQLKLHPFDPSAFIKNFFIGFEIRMKYSVF
jgi:hypothetical protein